MIARPLHPNSGASNAQATRLRLNGRGPRQDAASRACAQRAAHLCARSLLPDADSTRWSPFEEIEGPVNAPLPPGAILAFLRMHRPNSRDR